MKSNPLASRELVKVICRALAAKKAEDLRVLDVSRQSSITDYLVLATGTSEPHLRALRVELSLALAGQTRLVGVETSQETGWTVVDAFDVMAHLFTPEKRDRYSLESLWKDAVEVKVGDLLEDKPAVKAKPAVKKQAAKKSKPAPARRKPAPKAKKSAAAKAKKPAARKTKKG